MQRYSHHLKGAQLYNRLEKEGLALPRRQEPYVQQNQMYSSYPQSTLPYQSSYQPVDYQPHPQSAQPYSQQSYVSAFTTYSYQPAFELNPLNCIACAGGFTIGQIVDMGPNVNLCSNCRYRFWGTDVRK